MADSAHLIAELVGEALWPIAEALSRDASSQRAFLLSLGYSAPSPPAILGTLPAAVTPLVNALVDLDETREAMDHDAATASDVDAVLTRVFAGVVTVAGSVKAVSVSVAAELPGFEDRFYEYVLVRTVLERRPVLFAILNALGIFEVSIRELTDGAHQIAVPVLKFHSDRVGLLLGRFRELLATVYGFGTATIDTEALFANVGRLSTLVGVVPSLQFPTSEAAAAYGMPVPSDPADLPRQMLLPIGDLGGTELAVAVFPVSSVGGAAQPLALTVEVTGAGTTSIPLTPNVNLELEVAGDVSTGLGILLRPDQPPVFLRNVLGAGGATALSSASAELRLVITDGTEPPLATGGGIELLAVGGGSVLRADRIELAATARTASSGSDIGFRAALRGGTLSIAGGQGDGFIASVLPSRPIETRFDVGVEWSRVTGFHFQLSGSVETTVAINRTIGPFELQRLRLQIATSNQVGLDFSLDGGLKLGPVTVSVQRLGGRLAFAFVRGNLGPFDMTSGFLPPTGLGIAIEAGPVSGGGFLAVRDGTYFGALELSVYGVAVKAFGLIEATLQTGPGFSFVILISAEFTPIQLGLGFTLNGVGGLIGINRTVDAAALSRAVVDGKIDDILFPRDVVQNAPALVHDLGAYFPAAKDRTIFGPLAKIGWGTPTLVEGKLGFILELPGPILSILGNIQAHLPKSAPGGKALVILNLDIAGRLDFPKKHFELEGRLHDSFVGNYPVSGGMATRLDWGDRPSFAVSLGGFNPNFNPPSGFPQLQRLSVDLGLNGNPSVTLSGYLALTSNTAQIGAALDARVSKYGASLRGNLAFDALFVFSPFSFEADLSGGVHVDFHGVGFNLTFHGHVSGPSPWRITGEVCVGVWFASACVGFNETLGDENKPVLPRLDPWEGAEKDKPLSEQEVPGLKPALKDARNWSGVLPPGVVTGVSYRKDSGGAVPIDPVGVATFRQKAVPLDYAITRFAGTSPKNPGAAFRIVSVSVTGSSGPPLSTNPVSDYFAPGQYREMKNAEKLSSPAYDRLNAGFELMSAAVRAGAAVTKTPEFDTTVVDEQGVSSPAPVYTPTPQHLGGMVSAAAAARLGLRLSGAGRFTDLTLPRKVTDTTETYVVTNKAALIAIAGSDGGLSRSDASALADGLSASGERSRRNYQVLPSYLAQAA
jgi:hypothetical protein